MKNESLPEGLFLAYDSENGFSINDAQDIPWVKFSSGGMGDPQDWQTSVVSLTCKALGVAPTVWTDNGENIPLDVFAEYLAASKD